MFHDGQTIYTFRGPFGVPIEIGSSIVLLALVFVGFSFSSIEDLLWSLGIFAILMGSIFLHELGHAWGSIVQGVPVVLQVPGDSIAKALFEKPPVT